MILTQDLFTFIVTVYIVLVVQLTLTFTIVYLLRNDDYASIRDSVKQVNIFIYIILPLLLIVGYGFLPKNTSIYIRFILITFFALLKGILIYLISEDEEDNILESAMLSTVITFIGMTILGFICFYLGYDTRWMGIYLFAALIGLIIARIVMIFRKPSNQTKIYIIYFAIMLFSLYIVFNTNTVMMYSYKLNKEDYVSPALNFYIDFINLFLNYFRLEELE